MLDELVSVDTDRPPIVGLNLNGLGHSIIFICIEFLPS